MTLQAILWDLDGTLADTEALHYGAWRGTLATYGLDYTHEDFRRSFGRTNAEIIPELLGERSTAELVARIANEKEAAFRQQLRQEGMRTLAGVDAWLAEFRRRGLRQALASSGPMVNIIAILDTLGMGDFLDSVISGARLPKGKPDPTIFLLAAASVGARPDQCLVIEDSLAGVEAARRAAMRCVAVGSVIHNTALHDLLATIPGPLTTLVEQLTALTWETIEG
jgi:HAD superfamily hydrolase (TIGR01509 family)